MPDAETENQKAYQLPGGAEPLTMLTALTLSYGTCVNSIMMVPEMTFPAFLFDAETQRIRYPFPTELAGIPAACLP
jgi:hypothetical protein